MTKEEYANLLSEIAGGGNVVGQEVHAERRANETLVTESILNQYWGLIVSGDAICQFYVDTLREVSGRLNSSTPQPLLWLLHWHLVSCHRYLAVFDLFARGYYFESATLARTLWETALALAALQRGVVTVEDLFGGRSEGEQNLTHQQINRRVRQVDSRLLEQLVWRNPELSQAGKHCVDVFLNLLNNATHKSRLAITFNIERVQQGKPIPIFPAFNPKYTEVAGNILNVVTWCLMVSLSYLGALLPASGSPWSVRYSKVLLIYQEISSTSPSSVVKGFEEIISKVFTAH